MMVWKSYVTMRIEARIVPHLLEAVKRAVELQDFGVNDIVLAVKDGYEAVFNRYQGFTPPRQLILPLMNLSAKTWRFSESTLSGDREPCVPGCRVSSMAGTVDNERLD